MAADPAQGQAVNAPGGARARRALGLTVSFVGLLAGLLVAIWLTPREMSREQYLALDYFPMEQPRPLAPFSLTDHNGRPFTATDLDGRWSLLFFGYTYCPDICPTTLALLDKVAGELAADGNPVEPRIILVSVDPERDHHEQLAAYVTFFNEEFVGLTGELEELEAFAKQLYVPFGKVPGSSPEAYLVDHGANIIVVNPQGQYAGFLRPPHRQENMVRVLTSLLRR